MPQYGRLPVNRQAGRQEIGMPKWPAVSEVVSHAEIALGKRHRGKVKLGRGKRLTELDRRNLIVRCRVKAGPGKLPQSVIIKCARPLGYVPAGTDAASWGLFNDWAAT